ncbi:MAG: response regulator [Saprospiraceae bacterium]
MPEHSIIRLFIADDHQILIDGLRLIIEQESDLEVVGTAANGKQVLDQLKTLTVDVVLLDINLPIIDGIQTCKRLRMDYPQLNILALTSYKKGVFIQQMLKAGANGYVIKDAAADEIVDAIRKVCAGETYLSNAASQLLVNSLRHQTANNDYFVPQLTSREKEVLHLISAEKTTNEIAASLHLSHKTIETHRANLLAKFNVRNSIGLVKAALQKGLLEG